MHRLLLINCNNIGIFERMKNTRISGSPGVTHWFGLAMCEFLFLFTKKKTVIACCLFLLCSLSDWFLTFGKLVIFLNFQIIIYFERETIPAAGYKEKKTSVLNIYIHIIKENGFNWIIIDLSDWSKRKIVWRHLPRGITGKWQRKTHFHLIQIHWSYVMATAEEWVTEVAY